MVWEGKEFVHKYSSYITSDVVLLTLLAGYMPLIPNIYYVTRKHKKASKHSLKNYIGIYQKHCINCFYFLNFSNEEKN